MSHYILYNPLAGNGTCERRLETLKSLYSDAAEFVDMTKIESYADFARKLLPDDVIVIAGGDGTLNRFVNDIEGLDIKNQILYFAAGTGNDFLRDIEGVDPNLPFSVTEYIKDLPTVEVNGKKCRFINGIGYGIDGYCCEEGDRIKAKVPDKPVNYTAIAIKGLLFFFHPANARITVDGVTKEYKKVWIAPTMNGRFYGGGMMATPDQNRLNKDGTVSLMVWHGSGKLPTLMAFPGIFKGEHVKKKKMIDVYTAHEVEVEFDRPTALQIDGETVLGVTSYKVTSHARVPETV